MKQLILIALIIGLSGCGWRRGERHERREPDRKPVPRRLVQDYGPKAILEFEDDTTMTIMPPVQYNYSHTRWYMQEQVIYAYYWNGYSWYMYWSVQCASLTR